MRTAVKVAAYTIPALACCYLGLLTAWLLWRLPLLLTLFQPDTQLWSRGVRGLLPDLRVLNVNEMTLPRLILLDAGPLVLMLALLAIGSLLIAKVRDWIRLFVVFTVFWAGLLLIDAPLGFAQGASGSLTTTLRLVALADVGEPVFGIILTVLATLFVITVLARIVGLLHLEGLTSLRARLACGTLLFVAPIAVLNAVQGRSPFGSGFWRLDMPYVPTLVAAVTLLAAVWRSRPAARSLRLDALGGLTVLFIAAAAYAGGDLRTDVASWRPVPPQFEEHSSRYWDFLFEQDAFTPQEREEWGAAADQRLDTLAARLDVPIAENKRLAYVHLTAENKRAVVPERTTDSPFVIEPSTGALHHLLAVDRSVADARGEVHVLLREAWGEPASWDMAQAIARDVAGSYLGHDLTEYARRITCEERHYPLGEIFALDGEYLSPIVRDVLGGAWVESVVSKQALTLHDLHQSTPRSLIMAPGSNWELDWEAYMASLPCPDRSAPQPALHRNHKGITFTHEFRNGSGYGSDMAGKELLRIQQLGANAIALIPYASFSVPPSTDFRFRLAESDDRVVRSIDQAHAAGLQVMLKPQLWGRIFTGEIRYEREEDFNLWFARYSRWILHFARLAELHAVELFCIGNELNGVSGHEEHWRFLIREVRRIYSGPLTFAANWHDEFEQIAFWDDLDYLGVNFYFPLAERGQDPDAASPRLRELTGVLESMHHRYGKLVLFTEVGYPPLATAAAEPWKETKAAFDEDLQRDCYETVFEAFVDKPWFAGMYWWKWPSHGQGSAFDISHSPIGRPALNVLRDWYGKPWHVAD